MIIQKPTTGLEQAVYCQPDSIYFKTQILYKTEMCKKWLTFGHCPYNNQCRFAHGQHELKQRAPPNEFYKTKMCYKFFNEYACPYGNRCNFRHDQRTFADVERNYYMYLMNFNQLTQCRGYKARRLPVFIQLQKGSSLEANQDSSDLAQIEDVFPKLPFNQGSFQLSSDGLETEKNLPNQELIKYQTKEQKEISKSKRNLGEGITSFQICSVFGF